MKKIPQHLSNCPNAASNIRKSAFTLILLLSCSIFLEAQMPDPSGSILDPAFGETFYIKQNTRSRQPTPYVHEGERDIMWSKRVWRTIDLREKFNHPMYYPETQINDRKSLFDVIKEGIMTDEIYAYDNPFFDDEFKVRMTKGGINEMFFHIDTTYADDPNNPDGPQIMVPVPQYLTSRDIKQYWVKEDWFFDKERSVMDVRIIGLCPMKEKIDPTTGEMIGVSPLFWVYFPQCRASFARSEVYNTKNDAQRNTYDDLFQKRMFSSFVRKESNVMDREIASYAPGIDALFEADRVKDDIGKIEHDVWHL